MKPNRKLAVESVKRNVAAILRKRDPRALCDVMECSGFLSNTDHTYAEYADALVALAGVVRLDWLFSIVYSAAFHASRKPDRTAAALAETERCGFDTKVYKTWDVEESEAA
jgi:hypothetical protein